jgi:DNA-binding response OmpR family regulator
MMTPTFAHLWESNMAINLFKRKQPAQPAFSVMLICDDLGMSSFIDAALKDTGFTVHSMGTVAAALERLDEIGLPDVFIGDFIKPDVDGKAFLEKARIRFGKSAMPPVLFLMDSRDDETVAELLDVHDLLPKPFESEILVQRIQQLIESRLPADNEA